MTDEELLAWGRREAVARKRDLAAVDSAEALQSAQDNAAARRKLAGLTRNEAVRAVRMANVERAGRPCGSTE